MKQISLWSLIKTSVAIAIVLETTLGILKIASVLANTTITIEPIKSEPNA